MPHLPTAKLDLLELSNIGLDWMNQKETGGADFLTSTDGLV